MAARNGELLYNVYRALSYGASPLMHLHVRSRNLRGLENPLRWPERFAHASLPRPPGPLLWFHAVSLGEGLSAIPVIRECIRNRPNLNILMTTTTTSAFEVIKDRLPSEVIYQFAPIDTPSTMDSFLSYWKPNWIVLMESELWPNLVMCASERGTLVETVASSSDFVNALEVFIDCAIGTDQLVTAQNATEEFKISEAPMESIEDLKLQLAHRRVWMASSIHKGEEEVIIAIHEMLVQVYKDLVTIIVSRHPQHGREIAQKLRKEGKSVSLRSHGDKIMTGTSIYVVDTLGELRHLYRVTPIAVIGGSFLRGLTGHNISEAAASGCAVLTGPHVGHFSGMVSEMQQLNQLSVLQVSGKQELEQALRILFNDEKVLEGRRLAAREAYFNLSNGIVARAWKLLDSHLLNHCIGLEI